MFNLFLGYVYKTEKLKSIIRDQSLTLYTKINDKNFQGGEKGVFYKKPEQETFVTNRILVAFYFGKNSKHRQQQRHFNYKKLKSLHLHILRKKCENDFYFIFCNMYFLDAEKSIVFYSLYSNVSKRKSLVGKIVKMILYNT